MAARLYIVTSYVVNKLAQLSLGIAFYKDLSIYVVFE